MWNNQWPDDPSWFHANPFGQYPPSAPPQHSVPSQHSIPSQVSVPPQVYQSALGACSQSIPNRAAAAESRSLTPSSVSFTGQGSEGSSQSIPNRTAAAELRSLTPSPVRFSGQGSVGTDVTRLSSFRPRKLEELVKTTQNNDSFHRSDHVLFNTRPLGLMGDLQN